MPEQPVFTKHDSEKNRLELLPFDALELVGRIATYGARKYSPHNWRRCPTRGRYLGAALRHLFAYAKGEDLDPDSGFPHVGHAAWNCLALMGLILDGRAADDRKDDGA